MACQIKAQTSSTFLKMHLIKVLVKQVKTILYRNQAKSVGANGETCASISMMKVKVGRPKIEL